MQFQVWTGMDPSFQKSASASIMQCQNNYGEELQSIAQQHKNQLHYDQDFKEFVQRKMQWQWWSQNLIFNKDTFTWLMVDVSQGFGLCVRNGLYMDNHSTA
jgi:hypothetical protein